MSTSPKWGLSLIAAQQAQPEVTHNQAVMLLQALLGGVLAQQNAPPVGPVDGDCYLVGTAGSGAWAGRNNKIAMYYGGWIFVPGLTSAGVIIPIGTDHEGLEVYNQATDTRLRWSGTAWAAVSSAGIDQYSPPLASAFTVTSVGAPSVAPSVTDVANLGMVFSGGTTVTAADNIQLATQNIPGATPWTKSARFRWNGLPSRARAFGLALYDGTKVKCFGYQCNTSGAGLILSNYTTTILFSAALLNDAANNSWNAFEYFRIRDDGTNMFFEVSADGQNWSRFFQEARNTFLTATKIGFFINTGDVAASVAVGDVPSASIQWWN